MPRWGLPSATMRLNASGVSTLSAASKDGPLDPSWFAPWQTLAHRRTPRAESGECRSIDFVAVYHAVPRRLHPILRVTRAADHRRAQQRCNSELALMHRAPALLVDQPQSPRLLHRLCAIARAQPLEKILQVLLDRPLGYAEAVRNLLVGQTFGK